VLKIADTLYWSVYLAPGFGFKLTDFYQQPYGMWLLFTEIIICGVIPAIVLMIPQARKHNLLLFGAFALTCIGVIINRFVMTIQALATPVMPFDSWQVYVPTMYEVAPGIAMLAYCALVISLAYRYLPMFPREKELNPS
jgi:menaquinone reductase, integral membrane subunit